MSLKCVELTERKYNSVKGLQSKQKLIYKAFSWLYKDLCKLILKNRLRFFIERLKKKNKQAEKEQAKVSKKNFEEGPPILSKVILKDDELSKPLMNREKIIERIEVEKIKKVIIVKVINNVNCFLLL